MKPDFYKLLKENNIHSTFLNEEGVISALNHAYLLGQKNVLEWISNQKHLSDNIDYLLSEWKNQSQ